MDISWKMLGLAREYRLFNGKQIVGLLKNNFWNRKAYGELHGFLVRFEHEGFGKKAARILDIEGEKVLGTLDFASSPRSVSITYQEERFAWNLNKEHSKGSWSIVGAEETAAYRAEDDSGSQGSIKDAYLPPVVLLAGFYVHGYFFKKKLLTFAAGILGGILLYYLVFRVMF